MILCMTGTGPYSFDRVTMKLDELAGKHDWDVFIQIGHTDFKPKHCAFESFMGRENLQNHIEKCEMVICHGGFGSIRDALSFEKPVIAIPRIAALNEVQDDHQQIMVKALEKDGYIMAIYDVDQLEDAIEKAKCFKYKERQTSRIPSIINDFMYS